MSPSPPVTTRLPLGGYASGSARLPLKQHTLLHTPATPLPREVLVPNRDIISQRGEGQSCDMWNRWYVQKENWSVTPSCPKGKALL